MDSLATPRRVQFGVLTRAVEGLTQWRPLLLSFITLLLFGAALFLAQWLTLRVGAFLGAVMMLVAVVVMLAGTSGVGAMLMDKALNQSARPMGDALLYGALCIPKFLGFGVIVLAVGLVFMLVAAVVYFLCKIPVLGMLLGFVMHPVMVLAGAVLLVAFTWVLYPLFAPAVWSGLPFKAACASVLGIARQRLLEVVLMLLVLYVILSVISGLVLVGTVPSAAMLTGMAASILGNPGGGMGPGGMGWLYGAMTLFSGMSDGMTGVVAGLCVLMAVGMALLVQVALMGVNLVYLEVRAGLSTTEAAEDMDRLLGDVKHMASQAAQRAREAAEQAKHAAERARSAAEHKAREMAGTRETQRQAVAADVSALPAAPVAAPAAVEPVKPSAPRICGGCQAPVQSHEAFCGHCGHKLA